MEFNPPGNNYGIALGTGSPEAERLTIDLNGNVGIGTTSPQYALDVSGDIKVNKVIIGNSYIEQTVNSSERILNNDHCGNGR